MEENPRQVDKEAAAGKGNPVRQMFWLAVLYLPLGFFLWFVLASGLMFPASRLAEWLLVGLFPEQFESIIQLGFSFEVHTLVVMPQQVDGRTAMLNLDINPMLYAWGLAMMFGLIMATPMSGYRRLFQLLIALLVVTVVTSWGVFWEAWRDLAFLYGPQAAQAVSAAGLSPTAIALCYQLGYLVLPGVVPIAAWILMNRPFIERLVRER